MHFIHILGVIIACFVFFYYISDELKKLEVPLTLPQTLTWTHEYKFNGNKLRGFMEDQDGRNVYVVYTFPTENEMKKFKQISLAGQQFLVFGLLEEPNRPAHQYAFNMKKYLKSKGAIGIVEIANWSYVGTKESIAQKINVQRFKLKTHIEQTFPQSLVGEAQALLIGLQEHVDDEMTRAYQKLGITHLFAISGLHIAIVSFIFFQGLIRLKIRRELATLILLVILPIYGILAGGAPSVWRAVTVVELILLSRVKWRLSVDDALSISFILFVLLEPWSIYQIGFQLSYLATASLIYSGKILHQFSSWVVQSFFITFVCQLLVYPLLLFHFYEISISSFIVNIFFVPLFSFIILPINIILLVVSFIPGVLQKLLFTLYEPSRELLTHLINLLQSIPYQMWNPGKPSLILILIAYLSIFIVFYRFENYSKLYKTVAILCIPLVLIHVSGKLFNEMKISFVNVGQGDCIVVELPWQEEVYMIDTGGLLRFEQENWKLNDRPFEVGRQIVVPYLKGKGITKIDKLIITHADADHVEGAEEVLQEIKVEEIHITPNSYKKDIMSDLLKEAQKQKVAIKEQIASNLWRVRDISFSYLWPLETNYEGNNDSLVLLITRGDFQGLFTGDLEKEGEENILQNYPHLQGIHLLKAGHHGSKTSSSEKFVEQLVPNLTIFSAGENNRYGHPHEEVVERFQRLNLHSLTTGVVGTIEVSIKNNGMAVSYPK
ncbi:DNA internalization-related competence protein ComEC/Rec2 [Ureibacillus xyleni]|uniref:DNA internalization-related competence protein ComEC/Rec2 n=1 Tax=Ureibacillus xyleni TaxID=614648 RepID=UPI001EEDBED8|nr:DNA internalization-related competence protein ComEC/Rec2 [Ureibacillus xyleni]